MLCVSSATFLFAVDRTFSALEIGGRSLFRLRPVLTLWSGYDALVLVVLAAGALAWLVRRAFGAQRPAAFWRVVVPAVVLVGVAAIPLLWVGRGLASGDWISQQPFAPVVRLAPLGAGLVMAPVIVHLAFGERPAEPRRRLAWIVLLAFAVVAISFVDRRFAVGLYPEFHLFAHASAAVAAVLTCDRILPDPIPLAGRPAVAVACISAAATALAPLLWFQMPGPTRGALVFGSPVAAEWLRHVMPLRNTRLLRDTLAQLDVNEGRYELGNADAPRGLIDGRKFNVLFVVVDAMRADSIPPARPAEGTPFSQPGDMPVMDAWIEGTYRFSHVYSISTKTFRAMPGLFRSVEVNDDLVTMGVPMARRMENLGWLPTAVAVDYFFSPKWKSVATLVEGFDDMTFYEKSHNEQAIPATIEALRQLADQRFFLWLHMYNVHDPGFDGQLLTEEDCGRVECYRRSLRYLDGQFAQLLAGLDELGLREKTIIVLTADHGEGLGDHGLMLHGPHVYEEDVRVPLAIEIPGRPGGLVEEPAGTIDVAPTLVDLLGGRPDPQDRGRSLVPLMVGEELPPRPYYFENHNGSVFGVVSGRDKLIYDRGADVASRFDLENDPDEQDDLFEPNGQLEKSLLRTLIGFNPKLVKDELGLEETKSLLRERLDEVDPDNPGAALPLLTKLVAEEPDPLLVTRTVAIFRATNQRAVKLLLARDLGDVVPQNYGPQLGKWIDKVANTRHEMEVVSALAAQGQPAFAGPKIVARLKVHAAESPPEKWAPYLRLIRPWRRSVANFGEPLGVMLERAKSRPEAVTITEVELVLESVASLRLDGTDTEPLARAVRPWLEHDEPRLRAMAARALGRLHSKSDLPVLTKKLADLAEEPRVRRECAAALSAIEGAGAIDELVAAATNDPSLAVIVVREVASIGSDKGLPYLRDIAENHYNDYLRREAKKAIRRIEVKYGIADTDGDTEGDDESGG